MIITISGRRVKRLAKQTRTVRPAKALAPWTGSQWALTESGEAAKAPAQTQAPEVRQLDENGEAR